MLDCRSKVVASGNLVRAMQCHIANARVWCWSTSRGRLPQTPRFSAGSSSSSNKTQPASEICHMAVTETASASVAIPHDAEADIELAKR